jgi:hypothetical protein
LTDLPERFSTIEAVAEASRQQLMTLLDRVPAEWVDAAQ